MIVVASSCCVVHVSSRVLRDIFAGHFPGEGRVTSWRGATGLDDEIGRDNSGGFGVNARSFGFGWEVIDFPFFYLSSFRVWFIELLVFVIHLIPFFTNF